MEGEAWREAIIETYGELPSPSDWYMAKRLWETYRASMEMPNSHREWRMVGVAEKRHWMRVWLVAKKSDRLSGLI